MNYRKPDLSKSPKEIVSHLLRSTKSQLLIPPQYSRDQVEISELLSDEKSIGLFSSGSTADPKCIWNTFENLMLNAQRSAEVFEITSGHRLLILAKPWHVAGLSWALMAEKFGCEYEFITTNKGEGDRWLNAIQSLKPDFLLTVPPVLRALYDEEWFVANIVFGGTPFEYDDFHMLSNHCSNMYQGYGQTEAGGLISCHKRLSSEFPKAKEHQNCGRPINGVELRSEGSSSEPSEIYIKSETASIKSWYNSGDLGYIKDFEVHLTGRSNKVISFKN